MHRTLTSPSTIKILPPSSTFFRRVIKTDMRPKCTTLLALLAVLAFSFDNLRTRTIDSTLQSTDQASGVEADQASGVEADQASGVEADQYGPQWYMPRL